MKLELRPCKANVSASAISPCISSSQAVPQYDSQSQPKLFLLLADNCEALLRLPSPFYS